MSALAVVALLLLLGAGVRWRLGWRIPREQYEAYMQSAAWSRRKRRWRVGWFGWRRLAPWTRWCRVCWAHTVQAHHGSYARLGHELWFDLKPLCRLHHHEVTLMHQGRGAMSVERATATYLGRWRVRALSFAPSLVAIAVAVAVIR